MIYCFQKISLYVGICGPQMTEKYNWTLSLTRSKFKLLNMYQQILVSLYMKEAARRRSYVKPNKSYESFVLLLFF